MTTAMYHWCAELRNEKTGAVIAVGYGASGMEFPITSMALYNDLCREIESGFRQKRGFPENVRFILISLSRLD